MSSLYRAIAFLGVVLGVMISVSAQVPEKTEKVKAALKDTGLILESAQETNNGTMYGIVGRAGVDPANPTAGKKSGIVNIFKSQELALKAYDEAFKTYVGTRGEPDVVRLDVGVTKGYLRYMIVDPGAGGGQVRFDAQGAYRIGEIMVSVLFQTSASPVTPADKEKFIQDARSASKTWLLNFHDALVRQTVFTGEVAEIKLDRTEAPRFAAIKLTGVGFTPTKSDASAIHVNIMWNGKELFRIDRTMADGTLRRLTLKKVDGRPVNEMDDYWLWVPDDAKFGVNQVWAEEGISGRKSNVVEVNVTKVSAKQLIENFDALAKEYLAKIPENDRWYGGFKSGAFRNFHNGVRSIAAGVFWIPTAIVTLGHYQDELWPDNKFVCSWYQAETLGVLHAIRFDPDPKRRAMMDGFDYGPFVNKLTDIEFFAHFWVAVWPHTEALDPDFAQMLGAGDSKTAWQTTGIAFDPWPQQRAQIFPIKRGNEGWLGNSVYSKRLQENRYRYTLPRPIPDKFVDGKFKEKYPTTGGRYYFVDAPMATDLVKIRGQQPVGEAPKMLSVRSPVRLDIKDAAGKGAGLREDGTEYNDIEGCEIFLAKQADGHHEWYVDLPEGAITVTITGLADGQYTLLTKLQDKPAQQYPPVKVTKGAVSTIVLTDDAAPKLKTPEGTEMAAGPMSPTTTQPTGGIAQGPGSSTGSTDGSTGTGGTSTGGATAGGTGTGSTDTGTGTGTTGGTATGGTATGGAASGGTGIAGGALPGSGTGEPVPGVTFPLPENLSAKNLQVARWYTIRRITNFPRGEEVKFIRQTKISSNGQRIAFSAAQGFFTIAPDGSNLVRLSDKPCALMDISADGKKVAWYEGVNALFVANADGSGKEEMPGGLNVISMRLTADGSRLFVLVPDKDGILMLPADGSDVKKVMTTAAVCKLLEIEENRNHWRSLDISDDGSRIAFYLLWDLFTCNADGSDLRRVTKYKNYSLGASGYRISGDGRRLIHFRTGEKGGVVFSDSNGDNVTVFPRPNEDVQNLAIASNGSRVASSAGVRFFDADLGTYYDTLEIGAHSVHNPYSISTTADFKRAVIQIDGPVSVDQGAPSQLAVIDFNPPTLVGCPAIRDIGTKPKFLPNDFSTTVTLSALADPEIAQFGAVFVRNGARDPDVQNYFALYDNATNGDAKAEDGTFTNNALTVRTYSGKPMKPGPITLRVHAKDKAGNITVIDLEGLEVRQP